MLNLSYSQLEEDTLSLAREIYQKVDLSQVEMVSVSRGGLFVGGLLSYLLEIKRTHVICLESYHANLAGANGSVKEMIDFDTSKLNNKKIYLFVDDVNDSGQTGTYIRNKMKTAGLKCLFATVYDKQISKERPDFFGKVLPSDTWINFPWDQVTESFQLAATFGFKSKNELLEIGLEQLSNDAEYSASSK